jgi:hypothetical protein
MAEHQEEAIVGVPAFCFQNVGGVFTQITHVSFEPGFFQWCGVALSK